MTPRDLERPDAERISVRAAVAGDAPDVARLLHAFETEFGDRPPELETLAERVRELLSSGEMTVLLAGTAPSGFAQLRFRRSVLRGGWDAMLEELYVVPTLRGGGIGRTLLNAAIDTARSAGATSMEVGTSEDDVAAMALYESAGFSNREGGPEGPVAYFYTRDL